MPAEIHAVQRLSVLGLAERRDEPPPCLRLSHELLADNLVVGFERLNEHAQPYISIRSQLLKHAQESGQRVFAVTSAEPGNGKTHVAVNLAAALSRITPTVLIELDLRRPSLGARLGLPREQRGVDDFLDGQAPWRSTGVRVQDFDLTVHRVREARDNAAELLAPPRLASAIENIRAREDNPICIVDTPPIMVDDDFMLIARAIDGVLMIVEEGRTPKRALLDAMRMLNPTPVVGSILNMSISHASSTIDYGYYHADGRRPERRGLWRSIFGR
jgi:Mrp family chromosome partitioning ATPase